MKFLRRSGRTRRSIQILPAGANRRTAQLTSENRNRFHLGDRIGRNRRRMLYVYYRQAWPDSAYEIDEPLGLPPGCALAVNAALEA
jgi:hypothetical protein